MSFAIRTDRSFVRAAARSTRYVLVRLTAPGAPARERRLPVNVALVLDRSGSMEEGRKFKLARAAAERALRLLRPEDRFALAVYDTSIDVLAPSTRATTGAIQSALRALESVGPRGGTNLGAGWLRGCEQVAEFLRDEEIGRCLLLTDGLANEGITDRAALAAHAGQLRERGVATSTFGVGVDFDERLLRDMAHEGGGNFYFIEGAAQIPSMLSGELGEALEVTLRNAALEVLLPAGADAEPLSRFRSRRAHGDNELRIELGDLVSDQEMAVAVKVTLPPGEIGQTLAVRVALAADGALTSRDAGEVTWTYADHATNDEQPRDRQVDREVATLYAAYARAAAAEANRIGDYERAGELLEATAKRILSYAGDDEPLLHIVDELREAVPTFREVPMRAGMLKAMLFGAEATVKYRGALGRARRAGEQETR